MNYPLPCILAPRKGEGGGKGTALMIYFIFQMCSEHDTIFGSLPKPFMAFYY